MGGLWGYGGGITRRAEVLCGRQYLSGTFRWRQLGGFLAFFPGFLNFSSDAPKYRSLGEVICILFEICVKRPFQKCMGWGGGGR